MIASLGLGSIIISLTVIVHTFGLILVTHAMTRFVGLFRVHGRRSRFLAMVTVVHGIFLVMSIEVWLWASAYMLAGVVRDFETALYFSMVTFATVGYGDVVPPHEWRLFVALEGVNGFLLIGWSTAYLVAAGVRVGPFRSGEHF
jgi:hypothetical protein